MLQQTRPLIWTIEKPKLEEKKKKKRDDRPALFFLLSQTVGVFFIFFVAFVSFLCVLCMLARGKRRNSRVSWLKISPRARRRVQSALASVSVDTRAPASALCYSRLSFLRRSFPSLWQISRLIFQRRRLFFCCCSTSPNPLLGCRQVSSQEKER